MKVLAARSCQSARPGHTLITALANTHHGFGVLSDYLYNPVEIIIDGGLECTLVPRPI